MMLHKNNQEYLGAQLKISKNLGHFKIGGYCSFSNGTSSHIYLCSCRTDMFNEQDWAFKNDHANSYLSSFKDDATKMINRLMTNSSSSPTFYSREEFFETFKTCYLPEEAAIMDSDYPNCVHTNILNRYLLSNHKPPSMKNLIVPDGVARENISKDLALFLEKESNSSSNELFGATTATASTPNQHHHDYGDGIYARPASP